MLSNWTKATTTTTGTGTLTLAAVTDRPLPSASLAVGEYVQYSITTSDGKYESGIGKIAASNTLERSKVFSTYDGTTYNNLTATALTLAAGTHTVYLTSVAEVVFEPLKSPFTTPTDGAVFSSHIYSAHTNIVAAAAASRATAYPFRLEVAGVITGMAIDVATAQTGSTVDAAIYSSRASDGSPGERIVDIATEFDTSTTGYKTSSVTANKRINPGWYWAALCVTAGSVPTLTGGLRLRSPFGGSARVENISVREDAASALDNPFPSTNLYVYPSAIAAIPLIGLIMS